MCRVLVPAAFARSAIEMPATWRAASSRWDRSVMSNPTLGTDKSLVKGEMDRCVVASKSVTARKKTTNYRIGLLRQRAGVSRKALAEATGRSAKMIERYENGDVDPPAEVLVKMAGFLETTVDELLNVPPRLPSEVVLNGRIYVAAVSELGGDVAHRAAVARAEREALREIERSGEADPLEAAPVPPDDERGGRAAPEDDQQPGRAAG